MKIYRFESSYDCFRLTLAVGPREEFTRRFKVEPDEAADGTTSFPEDGSLACLVWMQKLDPDDPYDLSVLAHELLHCSVYRLNATGVDYQASDESLAYSVGELTRAMLGRAMKRMRRKAC